MLRTLSIISSKNISNLQTNSCKELQEEIEIKALAQDRQNERKKPRAT